MFQTDIEEKGVVLVVVVIGNEPQILALLWEEEQTGTGNCRCKLQ